MNPNSKGPLMRDVAVIVHDRAKWKSKWNTGLVLQALLLDIQHHIGTSHGSLIINMGNCFEAVFTEKSARFLRIKFITLISNLTPLHVEAACENYGNTVRLQERATTWDLDQWGLLTSKPWGCPTMPTGVDAPNNLFCPSLSVFSLQIIIKFSFIILQVFTQGIFFSCFGGFLVDSVDKQLIKERN